MDPLDAFAAAAGLGESETLTALRSYVQWLTERGEAFTPRADDDVQLRDYLLQLRLGGATPAALAQCTAALRQFYAWAHAAGLIDRSPFDEFNFARPYLDRAHIRRRA